MSNGKVYLVGAGPGDTELITLKGLRLIKGADVICYDHLISKELLTFAKCDAELITVGKFAAKHTLPQDQINALLIEKAKQRKSVVRLKGGDCYLFGRGGEEAEDCFDAGVEFEVVPGVTSALAAPCYAGIPPTHRDCTSTLAIVTGHRKKGDGRPIDIPRAGTVIFLMSVGNITNIIPQMLSEGWDADTKIAAVEHGTFYDQRTIVGTLGDFIEKTKTVKLRTPAIFVVGEVVGLRDKLNWFTKRPNVLVLGNHPERYQYLGNVIHRRMIECTAVDDYSAAEKALGNVGQFDWVVFTSVNGAKYMFDRLSKMGMDTRCLANAKIAAIGKSTAGRLGEFGVIADLVAAKESSAGLLEEFGKVDVAGKKILLPQAEVSSEQLPDGLGGLGAEVEQMAVYKTVEVEPAEIDFEYIDQILFTSGSTVRAFVKKFGAVPEGVKVYCLGGPTLAIAKEYDIEAEIVPSC